MSTQPKKPFATLLSRLRFPVETTQSQQYDKSKPTTKSTKEYAMTIESENEDKPCKNCRKGATAPPKTRKTRGGDLYCVECERFLGNERDAKKRLTGAQPSAIKKAGTTSQIVTKETHDVYARGKHFDRVTNPRHYVEGRTIEPIDVMHDWDLNPSEAAALKYLSRHKKKNGKEDLEKAIWYIKDAIKRAYPDA